MIYKITERLHTEYKCYADCEENVVFFDGKRVMKIFRGFYSPNSPVIYGSISETGSVHEITKQEFTKRLQELKAS